jgi:DNA-directed RNA polymerase beta subunit
MPRPDQRQADLGRVKEFFGSSQLSQFMDQTNPLRKLPTREGFAGAGRPDLRKGRMKSATCI